MEVIIATFIFSLIMVSTSEAFGRFITAYRTTRAIQRDLENAQFAVNSIAKMLRTSVVVVPTTPSTVPSIRIYDYSQASATQKPCIEFKFNNGFLQSQSLAAADITVCDTATFPLTGFSNMTTGFVTGNFSVTPSAASLVGKVTVSMQVCPSDPCLANPRDMARIQTTVSLRNEEVAP